MYVCSTGCLAVDRPKNLSLLLLMPWQYGDSLNVPIPGSNPDLSIDENAETDAWLSEEPLVKGYVLNWILFGDGEEETQPDFDPEKLDDSKAQIVDASKPITLPFTPKETKIEIQKLASEFSSLQIVPQNPDEPNVYHARIFIEKPVEVLMLKEMLIPYSFFPMLANPENPRESADTYISQVGFTDFSKYTEGGFVYVILNGYQYNFILKNHLFKGIKILQEIDYESLAFSNFHLGMNDEELNDYIKYLYDELQEAKERDPESVAILNRFHSVAPPEDFAIFGLLRSAVTRVFSHTWNLVRANTIRITGIKLSVKLSFDPRKLQPPKWIRDRMKINLPKFLRSALTPPKWIRDRLKVPREIQNLFVKNRTLWGRISITDPYGNPLKFKKRSRDLHLSGGKLRLSALPTSPQLIPDTNIPLPIPTGSHTANHPQVSYPVEITRPISGRMDFFIRKS